MPADNLYHEYQGGGGGMLSLAGSLALPLGVFAGHAKTTSMLAEAEALKAPGQSILRGIFRHSEAAKSANTASRSAVDAFFKGRGWDLGGRVGNAQLAVGRAGDAVHSTSIALRAGSVEEGIAAKRFGIKGFRGAFNKVIQGSRTFRAPMGRTIAALARPALGVGVAWYTWGSILPMIAEGVVGGVGEMIRFGESLRRTAPETAVGIRDMANRERAFTMRQAGAMAIHSSQTATRAALGHEADFLH